MPVLPPPCGRTCSDACEKMGVITVNKQLAVNKVEEPNVNDEYLTDKYCDVFEGLGCLPGDYHLELDTAVTPVKQCPRRMPLTLAEVRVENCA